MYRCIVVCRCRSDTQSDIGGAARPGQQQTTSKHAWRACQYRSCAHCCHFNVKAFGLHCSGMAGCCSLMRWELGRLCKRLPLQHAIKCVFVCVYKDSAQSQTPGPTPMSNCRMNGRCWWCHLQASASPGQSSLSNGCLTCVQPMCTSLRVMQIVYSLTHCQRWW